MQFIYDWEIPDPIFKEAVNKRLDFTNFLLFDELVINTNKPENPFQSYDLAKEN